MNYKFTVIGTLRPDARQRGIDYSRVAFNSLDETNLDEFVGIRDPAGHLTTWNKWTRDDVPEGSNRCVRNPLFYRLFYPTDALDWNCDGIKTLTAVTADLNNDGKCVFVGPNLVLDSSPSGDDVIIGPFITSGLNRTCETTRSGDDEQEQAVGSLEPRLLTGFNDWANPPTGLIYDGDGKSVLRLAPQPMKLRRASPCSKPARCLRSCLLTRSWPRRPLRSSTKSWSRHSI